MELQQLSPLLINHENAVLETMSSPINNPSATATPAASTVVEETVPPTPSREESPAPLPIPPPTCMLHYISIGTEWFPIIPSDEEFIPRDEDSLSSN